MGKKRKPRPGRFSQWLMWPAALALVYVLASAGLTWHFVFGYKGNTYQDPKARGIDYKAVEFRNERDQTLRAWYSPTPDRPVIVLMHGHRSNRGQLSALLADLYLQCRFGVLAFDFRASGESDGWISSAGAQEAGDLRAAVAFLESQGVARRSIGVVGYDMGGLAALGCPDLVDTLGACVVVASAEPPLRAFERRLESHGLPPYPLASLSVFLAKQLTRARLEEPQHGAGFARLGRVPFLAIGGEKDEVCPAERMRAAFGSADGVRRRLEILAGKTHAALVSAESPDVRLKIREFLVEWLGSD